MSDVSIVTITYNNYEELVETLKSTQGLSCERIVINGGTCSQTRAFLEARNDIISLSEPDKGISDAFNKGVRLATKKAVWFLNSGDVCIAAEFSAFAEQKIPDVDFVFSPILFKDDIRGIQRLEPRPQKNLGLGSPFLHPGLIVSRRLFDEIGYFDLGFKIAMDFDFICRMRKRNYQGVLFDKPTVLMDGTGISSVNPFRTHFESAKALRKNGQLKGRTLIAYSFRTVKVAMRLIVPKIGLEKAYLFVKKYIPECWRE